MARETFAITLDPGEPQLSDDCPVCLFPTFLIEYRQITSSCVRTVATVRYCPHCETVSEP